MKKPDLFYPVKPAYINQAFGANMNAFYKQQGLKGHSGIDFQAHHGQPIYAAHDGTAYPQIDSHGGNGVVLRSGTDYYTLYWHLIQDDAVVHTEQEIKAGDLLGYADNTGTSTGDHLHFGLCIIGTDQNNGYDGKIDPQPYFNGKFAEEINNPTPKFVFTKTLKLGQWNADVKEMQIILQKYGTYTGAVDGVFGPKTLKSLKDFQISHDLIPDGVSGIKTNAVLNSLLVN